MGYHSVPLYVLGREKLEVLPLLREENNLQGGLNESRGDGIDF